MRRVFSASFPHIFFATLLATVFLCSVSWAQGYLELRGKTHMENDIVPHVEVVLTANSDTIRTVYSDAKGRFTIVAAFGLDYKLHFHKKGYIDTYLRVEANDVPKGSRWIAAVSNIDPPMVPDDLPNYPVHLFAEEPYAIIKHNGKRSFEPDLDYYQQFQDKVLAAQEKKKESKGSMRKDEPVDRMVIAGRIIRIGSKDEPMALEVIHLKNIRGEIIQSFVTNQNGAFVFTKLPGDRSFILEVEESDPNMEGPWMVTDAAGKKVQKSTNEQGGQVRFDFRDPDKSGSSQLYTEDDGYRISIKGKLLNSQQAYAHSNSLNFRLVDNDGNLLHSTSDTNTLISFIKLLASNDYFLKVDNTENQLLNKTTLIITDSKGNTLRELRLDELEKFDYELLPSDEIRLVIVKADDGDLIIAGTILVGESPSKPLAFKRLQLIGPDGEVIETAVTNQFGSFVFQRLQADESFTIRVDEPDPKAVPIDRFVLTTSENEEVMAVFGDQQGQFEFRFTPEDNHKLENLLVRPENLRVQVRGLLREAGDGGQPMANEAITLTMNDGTMLEGLTDDQGLFVFTNLPADQAISISSEGLDGGKPDMSVALTDESNREIKSVKLDQSSGFELDINPSEITLLGRMYVADPWIDLLETSSSNMASKDEVVIAENIYYAVNDWKVQPSFEKLLDKVIQVLTINPGLTLELSSHTDSRGSDSYNLQLSEKRANAARDYLLGNGIASARIVSKGYGESRLINNCGNGAECDESAHAANRRVEFKVSIN